MKFCLLVLFGIIIISCNNNSIVNKNIKQRADKEIIIAYYKPDYSKKIDTILSVGAKEIDTVSGVATKETTIEIWGINISDIKKLPSKHSTKINLDKAVLTAEKYLKNRLNAIQLNLTNISIETINEGNQSNKYCFMNITFSYKEGAFQMVPMLLDGRIILSNKE